MVKEFGVDELRIGLIVSECNEKYRKGYYCDFSESIEERIKDLGKIFQESNNIDLFVTNNNFLVFFPNSLINGKDFIKKELIPKFNIIQNKKPIVIGFDLLTDRISFNPYNGIDAIVTFLDVDNNGNYVYKTHIWECWLDKKECNNAGFLEQNQKRVFKFKNKKFGLLSCGDIAKYCHNDFTNLPKVDIYLDLSHMSLNPHTSQYKIASKIIEQNKANYVFITHQVSRSTLLGYISNNDYKFIFPESIQENIEIERIESNELKTGPRSNLLYALIKINLLVLK